MADDTIQIDYSLKPEAFFFVPGLDEGLSALSPVDWFWRPVQRAEISAFAVSRFANHNEKAAVVIERAIKGRAFNVAIEMNSIPVLAQNMTVMRNAAAVNEKWLLSGPTGTRVRNRYANNHAPNEAAADAEVEGYFSMLHAATGPVKPLPVRPLPAPDTPFVIESRNLYDFYHFMTETLPRLQHAVDSGTTGPVIIHYTGAGPALFVAEFIDALFPEIAARVTIEPLGATYEAAVTSITFDHFYYQSPDRIMPPLDVHAPDSWLWQKRRPDRQGKRTLDLNSYDVALRRLRARAFDKLAGYDASHLPRRFWIAPAKGAPVDGGEVLLESLAAYGFATVQLETLGALEQIALIANAEVIVTRHGGALAHMIFAGAATHVIEVGHLQSAAARWTDYIPLAHVAGCRYTTFLADHATATPEVEPTGGDGTLAPVALSVEAAETVADYAAALASVRFTDAERLVNAAQRLKNAGALVEARRLLDSNAGLMTGNVALLQVYAQACDAMDEPFATFDTLMAMWDLDKTRFRTLEWMIWLTRRVKKTDMAADLVAQHKQHFPKRHKEFSGKIQWFHRMQADKG